MASVPAEPAALATPAPAPAVDDHAVATLRAAGRLPALALRLACPREGYLAFARVYAYFRWADDVVDAPGRDPAAVARFVVSQRALLAGARASSDRAEHALAAALDGPLGPRLRPAVDRMWAALAFDAARGPAPLPAADLDAQVARVGDAYLHALWVCSGADGAPPAGVLALARAATLVHVLRDLEVDRALGYVNTPPEVGPEALAEWVAARSDEAAALFAAGIAALPSVRPWRTRWLLAVYAWRYRRVLARIR